jgi:diaminopimelate epimerase
MRKQPTLKFTKMHGLGNDFVVIDTIKHAISSQDIPISALSNRYTGIGFDQLLLIGKSKIADFSCRFFNADGSEAEQCGNGIRCVARYIHENHLFAKKTLRIETKAGVIDVIIHDYDRIEAILGMPVFEDNKKLPLEKNVYDMFVLSLGNPHAVIIVDSIEQTPVKHLGHLIATHPSFPNGINVGFMQIVNPKHIILRTYERGVGETLACGSNACAAAIAGIQNDLLEPHVTVELPLGCLQIHWQGKHSPVVMIGPAAKVFDGAYRIND